MVRNYLLSSVVFYSIENDNGSVETEGEISSEISEEIEEIEEETETAKIDEKFDAIIAGMSKLETNINERLNSWEGRLNLVEQMATSPMPIPDSLMGLPERATAQETAMSEMRESLSTMMSETKTAISDLAEAMRDHLKSLSSPEKSAEGRQDKNPEQEAPKDPPQKKKRAMESGWL